MTPHHELILETFPDSISPLHTSQATSDPVQKVIYLSNTYVHIHNIQVHDNPLYCVQALVNVRDLSGAGSPLAMATGYLRQYQSMVQIRQQVYM